MKSTREIKSTKTTSFGSTKRENHDSSKFYARKLYQNNSEKNIEEAYKLADVSSSLEEIKNYILNQPSWVNTFISTANILLSNLPNSSF